MFVMIAKNGAAFTFNDENALKEYINRVPSLDGFSFYKAEPVTVTRNISITPKEGVKTDTETKTINNRSGDNVWDNAWVQR